MEKIEIVLRREQNNRNGSYLNYINGYWYTYEWSAFLLCMLHPEVEVRKCIGVQPDENYAIARVNKKIIKKLYIGNLELPKGGNYVVFNCTTCYNINYSIQIN